MCINSVCTATKAFQQNLLLLVNLKLMHYCCLLLLCCLLGLGSAWNQPSTCYVRQSSSSSGAEKLDEIQETLASNQQTIATSFDGFQQTINILVGEWKLPTLLLFDAIDYFHITCKVAQFNLCYCGLMYKHL